MGDPAELATRRKAMSDPLRLRIWECVVEPRTVKEIGSALGVEPNRLYYHLRLLEQAALIKVVGARAVGRSAEKLYGVTQDGEFGNDLAGTDPVGQAVFFSSILEATRADVEELIFATPGAGEAHPPSMHVLRTLIYASPEAVGSLSEEIAALIQSANVDPTPGARLHVATLVLCERPGAP